jgi:hypothetical protein
LLKTPPASVVTFGATNLLGNLPQFTDPRRFDYVPAAESTLLSQGTNLGVPTDLNGKPRGPQPSIGAYER